MTFHSRRKEEQAEALAKEKAAADKAESDKAEAKFKPSSVHQFCVNGHAIRVGQEYREQAGQLLCVKCEA